MTDETKREENTNCTEEQMATKDVFVNVDGYQCIEVISPYTAAVEYCAYCAESDWVGPRRNSLDDVYNDGIEHKEAVSRLSAIAERCNKIVDLITEVFENTDYYDAHIENYFERMREEIENAVWSFVGCKEATLHRLRDLDKEKSKKFL